VNIPARGLVAAELAALAAIVAAHVVLLTVLLHTRTTFDEGVYLLSLDELRHGQALGRQVFASQGPGFYLLLQAIGGVFGVTVAGVRLGIVTLDAIGAVFAFLLGRRVAGPLGGLGAAAMIAIAPKLGDSGGRVFADQCAMVLVVVALFLVAVRQPLAAGAVYAAAVLVKVSALTALPTMAVLLALDARRARALAEAIGGALVLVAVVALVFVRDLGGIWAGAVTYHLDSRRITGLIGRHEFEGFFAVRTPFLWLTVLALILLPIVWRRVWPYWLWRSSPPSSSSATSRCATATCSYSRTPSPCPPGSRSGSPPDASARASPPWPSPQAPSLSPPGGSSSSTACGSTSCTRTLR